MRQRGANIYTSGIQSPAGGQNQTKLKMETSYQALTRSLSPDQPAEGGDPSASKRSLDPKRRGSKDTAKNYRQTLKLPRLYSSKRFILKHPTTSKPNSKQVSNGQSKVLDTTYFPVPASMTTRPGPLSLQK